MKARISRILPETSRTTRALVASVVVTAAAFVGLVVVLQPPDSSTTAADWLNTDAGSARIHQTIRVVGDETTPTGESDPAVFTNVNNPATSAALQ